MKSPPQLMEYITYNSYNLTLNLFGALCNSRGVRSPNETTIFPWCLGCDNIWISKVLKIFLSPKTNGKYTEATLQPPNSNGLLTLSVYFFIVVCKNESFCHRNHFRGLYVAAIRQVTKPLCWQQEVVIILLLLFTNNFPFLNFTSFFICPSLRKPRP